MMSALSRPFTHFYSLSRTRQHQEKKPKDHTITEKFNTYRFADYKEHVIDLLMRVCAVSVQTMQIIKKMENKQMMKSS